MRAAQKKQVQLLWKEILTAINSHCNVRDSPIKMIPGPQNRRVCAPQWYQSEVTKWEKQRKGQIFGNKNLHH